MKKINKIKYSLTTLAASFFLYTQFIGASSQKQAAFTDDVPYLGFSELIEKNLDLSIKKGLAQMQDSFYSYSRLLTKNKQLLKKLDEKNISILFSKDKKETLLFYVALKNESEKNWESFSKVLGLEFSQDEKKLLDEIAQELKDFHNLFFAIIHMRKNGLDITSPSEIFSHFALDKVSKFNVDKDFVHKIKKWHQEAIQKFLDPSLKVLDNNDKIYIKNIIQKTETSEIKNFFNPLHFESYILSDMPSPDNKAFIRDSICMLLAEKLKAPENIKNCIDLNPILREKIKSDLNYKNFNLQKNNAFIKLFDLLEKKTNQFSLKSEKIILNESIDKDYAIRSLKHNLMNLNDSFVEGFANLSENAYWNTSYSSWNWKDINAPSRKDSMESISRHVLDFMRKIIEELRVSKAFILDEISIPILSETGLSNKSISIRLEKPVLFDMDSSVFSIYQVFVIEFLKNMDIEKIYPISLNSLK